MTPDTLNSHLAARCSTLSKTVSLLWTVNRALVIRNRELEAAAKAKKRKNRRTRSATSTSAGATGSGGGTFTPLKRAK